VQRRRESGRNNDGVSAGSCGEFPGGRPEEALKLLLKLCQKSAPSSATPLARVYHRAAWPLADPSIEVRSL
jgi:hypothetical protein